MAGMHTARHPLLISAIVIAHVLGTLFVRWRLKNATERAIRDTIQFITVLAFLAVIFTLYYHGGGTEAWPTILPLACAQASAQLAYIVIKHVTGNPFVRIDGAITSAATIVFVTLAIYVIFPDHRKWARHATVMLSILYGLPLAYTLPSLIKVSGGSEIMSNAVTLSELIYSRKTSATFVDVEFFHDQKTGARCGVYEDHKNATIYVAFAGSNSKVDWIKTNLDVETEQFPYAGCKQQDVSGKEVLVHKGFLSAWKSIRDPVWNAVSNIMLRQGGSGRLVVCGHSLGGALACIAALDLACLSEPNYRESLAVLTFGAPRVGDEAFKRAFDSVIKDSVRVTTVFDPVPKVIINDFVHIGRRETVMLGTAETVLTAHSIRNYKTAVEKTTSLKK